MQGALTGGCASGRTRPEPNAGGPRDPSAQVAACRAAFEDRRLAQRYTASARQAVLDTLAFQLSDGLYRHAEAAELYRSVRKRGSAAAELDDVYIYLNLGVLLNRVGTHEARVEAIAAFRVAAAMEPDGKSAKGVPVVDVSKVQQLLGESLVVVSQDLRTTEEGVAALRRAVAGPPIQNTAACPAFVSSNASEP